MKCPKISNPNDFVELKHEDNGIIICNDADGFQYSAYVTTFSFEDKKLYSCVDVMLAENETSIGNFRFQQDCLLLAQHDLDLKKYADNMI